MSNRNIKHYLLSDEDAKKIAKKFGQFIMTKSGSIYVDLDETTRIQLTGDEDLIYEEFYLKTEVDEIVKELKQELTVSFSGLQWQPAVDTYEDIAIQYPSPMDGWTVNIKTTGETYRYNGVEWILISSTNIPLATIDLNGLLSKEDKAKIDNLSEQILSQFSEDENGTLFYKNKEIKVGDWLKIDKELDAVSENPIQNQAVYNELHELKINAVKNIKVAYINHQYTRNDYVSAGTAITNGYTGTEGNLIIAAFMYRSRSLNKINGFESWTYLGTSCEEQELINGIHDHPQQIDYYYKFSDGNEDTLTWSVNLANNWTTSLFVELKNADRPFWREDLIQEKENQNDIITLDKRTDNCVLFGLNSMYFSSSHYNWVISSSTVRQIPAAAEKIIPRVAFIMDNNEAYSPFTVKNPYSTLNAGQSVCGIEIPSKMGMDVENIYFAPTLYSQEEQCIGSWLDGKPLYQKTINITLGNANNPWTYSNDILENVDMCFINQACIIIDENHKYGIPGSYETIKGKGMNLYFSTEIQKLGAWVTLDMFFDKVVYVTLQYTKTTDKENSFIDSMVSDYLPIEGGNNDEVTDDQVAQAIVDTLVSLERSE